FTGIIINGPASTQFNWNFGPNANPTTASTQHVNNVAFSVPNGNVVKLVGTYSVCKDSVMKPIFFYDKPNPQIAFQTDHECVGFTQVFTNSSTGSNAYSWDFGVPGITTDVSNQITPTYTYP